MDAFEENLQTFNGSINGPEMRESLYRCFLIISTEIRDYSAQIQTANSKIKKLEGEVQNGNV